MGILPVVGFEDLPLQTFFARAKEAGYDGVEMTLPFDEREREVILSLLEEYGLKWIAQHHETSDLELADYLKNYERRLHNLAAAKPLFINSQSGKDFFSFAQNKAILERAAVDRRRDRREDHPRDAPRQVQLLDYYDTGYAGSAARSAADGGFLALV